MSLELIIGCMFSGKSTEMIKRIRKYKLLEKQMLIVTHSSDMRYGTSAIISHDKIQEPAVSTQCLHELFLYDVYEKATHIFIEEAQFFDDLFDFVKYAVEKDNKHIFVTGLDGNYKKEPFRQIVDLIPFADEVTKLSALCVLCKDGTKASFSKRITRSTEILLVGGSDSYISVCRKHHNFIP